MITKKKGGRIKLRVRKLYEDCVMKQYLSIYWNTWVSMSFIFYYHIEIFTLHVSMTTIHLMPSKIIVAAN